MSYLTGTENGHEFIECGTCHKRSFSRGDIENKYCGYCHMFHVLESPENEEDKKQLFIETGTCEDDVWVGVPDQL